MTVWKLIHEHKKRFPDSHFFDKETLRFFGERLSDMIVWKSVTPIKDFYGNVHLCYILSSLQRNAPGGSQRKYHYFDTETFEHITE